VLCKICRSVVLCDITRDSFHPDPRADCSLCHSLAFILYRQHYQAQVVAQHPGLANPEISKIIGEQWREQAPEVKSDWKRLAEVRIWLDSCDLNDADSFAHRKKSNDTNDNTQAIDTNLKETENRQDYALFRPPRQRTQDAARSAVAGISLPRANISHHSHQPLELPKLHATSVSYSPLYQVLQALLEVVCLVS
jgi:hypothetical protein